MTFLRQRETSRISSRGKGPVYNTGGGGGGGNTLITSITPTDSSSSSSSSNSLIVSINNSSSSSSSRLLITTNPTTKSSPLSSHAPPPATALIAGDRLLINNYSCCSACSKLQQVAPSLDTRGYKSNAACMIIEERCEPRSIRPRISNGSVLVANSKRRRDSERRFGNLALSLLKHRTTKFSSNRHRKLQAFRET